MPIYEAAEKLEDRHFHLCTSIGWATHHVIYSCQASRISGSAVDVGRSAELLY